MPRAKTAVASRRRRKRVLKEARGFRGTRGRLYRAAKDAVRHALKYAYIHRRLRKRDFRRLWIARINAAARTNGINYSQFISGLKRSNIALDRKVLAEIAFADPGGFKAVVQAID